MTNPFAGTAPTQGGFAAQPAAPQGGAFNPQKPAAAPQGGGAFTAATNNAVANQGNAGGAEPYVPIHAPAQAVFGALPEGGSVADADKRNLKQYNGQVVVLKFHRTLQVPIKARGNDVEAVESEWLVFDANGAVCEKVIKQYIFGKFIVQDAKNALAQGISVVPALVKVEVVQGNESPQLVPITDPNALAVCEQAARDNGFL